MICYCLFLSVFILSPSICAFSENKYSRSDNVKKTEYVQFRTLQKPFRMNKLNLLWAKAQQPLTEPKLKSLYSDLMIHDKEEILFKSVKGEGGDKDGLKEAELQLKLLNLLKVYGLNEQFEDTIGRPKEHPNYNSASEDINKSLFNDNKLNILWSKAEMSGFTSEELSALREVFSHHQEKTDQNYDLQANMDAKDKDEHKNAVNEKKIEIFNEKDYSKNLGKYSLAKRNLVGEKHKSLRDGYDRLQRMASKGPNDKEFMEPKVQGLWKLAVVSNFTVEELASLKLELHNYENHLLMLRTLHADHVEEQQQLIKKDTRNVARMHADLESRILARHTEL